VNSRHDKIDVVKVLTTGRFEGNLGINKIMGKKARMKFISILLLLITALASSSTPAHAQTGGTVQKELEALYQKMDEALVRKDLKAFESHLTPDWQSMFPGEKPLSFKEIKAQMKKYKVMDSLISRKTMRNIEDVKLEADTATVTFEISSEEEQKDLLGQYGPKDQIHHITSKSKIEDTWIKSDKGWKQKIHLKLVSNQLTIDGKVPGAEDQ
jgi:hypothetical protein